MIKLITATIISADKDNLNNEDQISSKYTTTSATNATTPMGMSGLTRGKADAVHELPDEYNDRARISDHALHQSLIIC
jgi:hypothetical protein